MVEQIFLPSSKDPCVVQVNYRNGNISFYPVKDAKEAFGFYGKIVAIFKPKSKNYKL
jgi:hypothetical protein